MFAIHLRVSTRSRLERVVDEISSLLHRRRASGTHRREHHQERKKCERTKWRHHRLVFSNSSTRLSSSFFERGVCTKRVLKVTTRMQKNGDICFLALKKNCFGLQKIFSVQNKKRRKTTRDTMYSAMSSIPSGGPPGNTHTKELRHTLRGIDARLESVLSTYKYLLMHVVRDLNP